MSNKTTDVAMRFVDLALKHTQWEEIKTLPADEVQVLFDAVSAAGFNPKTVKPGKLFGHYFDQDGGYMDETYLINDFCPFKVVSQGNGNYFFATGWLNCVLRRVVYGLKRQKENRERLIEVVSREIERSVPLEPIRLSSEEDFLHEHPPNKLALIGSEYFVNHTRDENDFDSCVGIHRFCNGWLDRKRATETHDAIVCRGCRLRILFPKEVKTYGDFRKALTFPEVQASA